MTHAIDTSALERFRSVIAERLGLRFDEDKFGTLSDVLRRRSDEAGCDVGTYLARLETRPHREVLAALAPELTVPETYFFRNHDQFRAFAEVVLPDRRQERGAGQRLQILSLGCASGEEPYTLAMFVRDTFGGALDVSILGVDVNPAVIERARRGRFSTWALRETPELAKRRWFRADGHGFVLDDGLRESVRFEQRNLVEDDSQFWQPGSCDVVFCRNVIMYFSPDQARAVVDRISRVLRPGGFLFLGHAETLRGISGDFHLRHTHGTFYYQKKEHAAERRWPAPVPEGRRSPAAPLATVAAEADTWIDAIRQASERVIALTDPASAEHAGGGSTPAVAAKAWDLGVVLELLRMERFAEALTIIDALPPESGRDRDVQLLRAVLLVHGGHLERAEDACRRLLEVDELSAGAHYLLALCREGAGDRAGASHHDQVAAYLDPGFAMPRLHLGLLARRAGDRDAARKELVEAMALLQREDASRVLLFGGGFSREVLLELCRAELIRCGGQP